MGQILIYSEHRGVPGGHLSGEGTPESTSQTPRPTPTLTHFLRLPWGLRGRAQGWEAGRRGSWLHPTPMPQFLWSPRKEGAARKGKERKCAASWEVLGQQVLS